MVKLSEIFIENYVNKQDGKLFSTGNLTLLALMCRFAGELLHNLISEVELTQSMRRVEQA